MVLNGSEDQAGLSDSHISNDSTPGVPMEEYYCILHGNNLWYAFLRLHHLLLTRLFQLRTRSQIMQQENTTEGVKSNSQVADVLRLRKKGKIIYAW